MRRRSILALVDLPTLLSSVTAGEGGEIVAGVGEEREVEEDVGDDEADDAEHDHKESGVPDVEPGELLLDVSILRNMILGDEADREDDSSEGGEDILAEMSFEDELGEEEVEDNHASEEGEDVVVDVGGDEGDDNSPAADVEKIHEESPRHVSS